MSIKIDQLSVFFSTFSCTTVVIALSVCHSHLRHSSFLANLHRAHTSDPPSNHRKNGTVFASLLYLSWFWFTLSKNISHEFVRRRVETRIRNTERQPDAASFAYIVVRGVSTCNASSYTLLPICLRLLRLCHREMPSNIRETMTMTLKFYRNREHGSWSAVCSLNDLTFAFRVICLCRIRW